jgi:hypothetical protein
MLTKHINSNIIVSLLVLIVSGGGISCDGSLCNIQLNINGVSQKTKELQFNTSDLYFDTDYEVNCFTSEEVRMRNVLSLKWTNKETNASLMSNTEELLSNRTFKLNNQSYLQSYFRINSINEANRSEYILFCRFLTVDPSVYCERTLAIRMISPMDKRFKIFFAALSVLALLGLINMIIKIYLRRRVLTIGDDQDAAPDVIKKASTSRLSKLSLSAIKSNGSSIRSHVWSIRRSMNKNKDSNFETDKANDQQDQRQDESDYGVYPIPKFSFLTNIERLIN